jgi:hypothetical protein
MELWVFWNANLLIGAGQIANREIGVPRRPDAMASQW